MNKVLLLALTTTLIACESTPPLLSDMLMKPIGERMMCTAQYEPICATIVVNGVTKKQTFSNACVFSNYKVTTVIKTTVGQCQ